MLGLDGWSSPDLRNDISIPDLPVVRLGVENTPAPAGKGDGSTPSMGKGNGSTPSNNGKGDKSTPLGKGDRSTPPMGKGNGSTPSNEKGTSPHLWVKGTDPHLRMGREQAHTFHW
jgi:hypothetical protein